MILTPSGSELHFPKPLLEARIVNRPNRFIMYVELDGKVVKCHCPSTGRIGGYTMDNLLCLLSGPHGGSRTTEYTVEAFAVEEKNSPTFQWIGINQTAMNSYVRAALEAGLLKAAFPTVNVIEAEKKLGASRIDFKLNGNTWVEVKMPLTVLEISAPALTPKDFKPTIGINRMVQQLGELTAALTEGEKAILLSTFAYTKDAAEESAATSRRNFNPLPSIVKAQEAGLERWQLHFSFHETHLTVESFFRVS